jgi:uncharacterized protein
VPRNLIAGPAGPLESDYTPAAAGALPVALAVVCHPHPLHGGTMDNKVVTTLVRFFAEQGAAVLRFNFRGVGQSGGQFDDGNGEGEDLRAAVQWLADQYPDQVLPLWLAGFSFGSFVSARMAPALGADRLLSIAPPVTRWGFDRIQRIAGPWIVVQGDADEVVDASAVYQWLDTVNPPPLLLRMPAATHFFHGLLVELRSQLGALWSTLR